MKELSSLIWYLINKELRLTRSVAIAARRLLGRPSYPQFF